MTYEEGSAVREKWALGAVAEYHGFADASSMEQPQVKYATLYEQQRYDQGFADGKAMLMFRQVTV